MTLDTVRTAVAQTALNTYVEVLNRRGEVYSFVVSEITSERTVLELSRDGTADGVELVLSADGTWEMVSYLVVGDSRDV